MAVSKGTMKRYVDKHIEEYLNDKDSDYVAEFKERDLTRQYNSLASWMSNTRRAKPNNEVDSNNVIKTLQNIKKNLQKGLISEFNIVGIKNLLAEISVEVDNYEATLKEKKRKKLEAEIKRMQDELNRL
jgi:hypothetical protein